MEPLGFTLTKSLSEASASEIVSFVRTSIPALELKLSTGTRLEDDGAVSS